MKGSQTVEFGLGAGVASGRTACGVAMKADWRQVVSQAAAVQPAHARQDDKLVAFGYGSPPPYQTEGVTTGNQERPPPITAALRNRHSLMNAHAFVSAQARKKPVEGVVLSPVLNPNAQDRCRARVVDLQMDAKWRSGEHGAIERSPTVQLSQPPPSQDCVEAPQRHQQACQQKQEIDSLEQSDAEQRPGNDQPVESLARKADCC
jgi:hypothetical protein